MSQGQSTRHATRGRNLAKGEDYTASSSVRSTAEIELDMFLQEAVLPVLGQHRYAKLLELVDTYGTTHYGRGYVQGGKDERRG